jgi:biotin-(acetyl-CoA carboxylase) ligase
MEFENRMKNDYEPLEEVFQKATTFLASIKENRKHLETSSPEDLLELWKNELEDYLNEWANVKNTKIVETYSFIAVGNMIKSNLRLIQTNGRFVLSRGSKIVLEVVEENIRLFTLNIPRILDEMRTNEEFKNLKRKV